MSRDGSTHIRITAATRERLLALIETLTRLAEKGQIEDCRDQIDSARPYANPVSFDKAINVLLDRHDAHQEAAARAAAKRKAAKAASRKGGTTAQEK